MAGLLLLVAVGVILPFAVLRSASDDGAGGVSPDSQSSAANSVPSGLTATYAGRGATSDQRVPVDLRLDRLYAPLPKDAIPPVYNPEFVPAAEADLLDNTLVIGLAINGEARAYPVEILTFREMVNDVVGGVPVLVTW